MCRSLCSARAHAKCWSRLTAFETAHPAPTQSREMPEPPRSCKVRGRSVPRCTRTKNGVHTIWKHVFFTPWWSEWIRRSFGTTIVRRSPEFRLRALCSSGKFSQRAPKFEKMRRRPAGARANRGNIFLTFPGAIYHARDLDPSSSVCGRSTRRPGARECADHAVTELCRSLCSTRAGTRH